MFLDLTPGNSNLLGGYEWEIRSPWAGASSMLNTGASRKEEHESSLSQILEDSPHPRYYLSPKACLGILRRSKVRGKPLPKRLEAALLAQAGLSDGEDIDTDIHAYHMDMLQLEESEYDLIRYPQRGVCLYKCGNERYLLEVHAPPHKETLFGTAGGR